MIFKPLRDFVRNLPALLLAFALAVAVWISAVTASDPTQERIYPRLVQIETVGLDPNLVVTKNLAQQVSLTISAPSSIWERIINEQIPVRAVADLTGLAPGEHAVPIQIQIGIRPAAIRTYSPRTLQITLEELVSRRFAVTVLQRGELGVGYQSGKPVVTPEQVLVSGPKSAVDRVAEVRLAVDLNRATESIQRLISLQAVDNGGSAVSDVSISPNQVDLDLGITQRGGYRNVVVKVVLKGQVVDGYRVTNISVFPPAVTVFSTDPQLVEDLPGYVETAAMDLNGVKDDVDVRLPLSLPPGVQVVGDQTVAVQVGVASIEGSLTLNNMQVEVIGLEPGYIGKVSPAGVDVFLTGPVPLLSSLSTKDLRVVVDLTGEKPGTYQRVPRVEILVDDITVQSILPGSVEIVVEKGSAGTRTP